MKWPNEIVVTHIRTRTQFFLTPFICLRWGKPPLEDVLDMFKLFFPILPKMPNLMLIVYLPKIFSSVAGLFPLDPLNLLSAGTVLTWLSPVSGVSQVCSCVYLSRDHYNEKHAKMYRYGVLCHFAKHTVSIKAGNWPAKKLNSCQIHSFDATKMACTKK